MSAYDISQWTDFVRGLTDAETASTMARHLANDAEALRLVTALRRVQDVATRDRQTETPAHLLRQVKALGSVRRTADGNTRSRVSNKTPNHSSIVERIVMALTFDSLAERALEGVRDMQPTHQQLFFEHDGYAVELRYEPHVAGNHAAGNLVAGGVVVGQLLRSGGELEPMRGIPVTIDVAGETVAETTTGPLGELQVDGLRGQGVTLRFSIAEEMCLEVSIPISATR